LPGRQRGNSNWNHRKNQKTGGPRPCERQARGRRAQQASSRSNHRRRNTPTRPPRAPRRTKRQTMAKNWKAGSPKRMPMPGIQGLVTNKLHLQAQLDLGSRFLQHGERARLRSEVEHKNSRYRHRCQMCLGPFPFWPDLNILMHPELRLFALVCLDVVHIVVVSAPSRGSVHLKYRCILRGLTTPSQSFHPHGDRRLWH
jgi:hypothetical protein